MKYQQQHSMILRTGNKKYGKVGKLGPAGQPGRYPNTDEIQASFDEMRKKKA